MSWQFWSSCWLFAIFVVSFYGTLIFQARKAEKYFAKWDELASELASMSHDNPDGPCECGGTHTLASEEDRRHFAKEEIRKQLLNVIHGCEEEIESKFREIKGWMELLDDPP